MIKAEEKTTKWNLSNNISEYKNFRRHHTEDIEVLNNTITEMIQKAQETYSLKSKQKKEILNKNIKKLR
ncbi:hypothetical protein HN011_000764, partial [Eciton burchellii]